MSAIRGVTVNAEVTDWRALGDEVATASSTEQAAFLMGFAQALSMKQVPYIADDLTVADEFDTVLDTIGHLKECLEHRKGATT